LIDLWQLGGAAVLGHTPAGVLREFKNTAERGLFAPFHHPLEGRLVKALTRLFPGGDFRIYADEFSLRRALGQAGWDVPFPDPAFSPEPEGTVSLWRPFLLPGTQGFAFSPDTPLIQRPILPLSWPGSPRILVLDKSQSHRFPPSDPVSPVILAAAVRGIYDLLAAGDRGRPQFPKIKKALTHSRWLCRGIYLTLPAPPDEAGYAGLFRDFLDHGFLLPPDAAQPLILPGVLSPGEEAALAGLL
jgi:hypothetical protein